MVVHAPALFGKSVVAAGWQITRQLGLLKMSSPRNSH